MQRSLLRKAIQSQCSEALPVALKAKNLDEWVKAIEGYVGIIKKDWKIGFEAMRGNILLYG